jgi:hypothetical protein
VVATSTATSCAVLSWQLSELCADAQVLLSQIIAQEPLISDSKRPALRQLLQRLICKLAEPQYDGYNLFKVRMWSMEASTITLPR